ncbi:hypothetical protein KFL_001410200 [Klebsormidium nitens]|uniref:Uncharacterized protein n=1 Tax=Klebsormidium nitens TaxID=105231 RepID=A0A0U9HSY8_KLENI|nr:hypothetical protein KFL_001410200 [Klebsormidium nitens]|eukprot:GAQ83262.1 hypothetical protein KFL_001410200 [Klebsormidium nitens]
MIILPIPAPAAIIHVSVSYCDGKGVLLVATQSLFRFGVCGVTGAPACTTAIAPYSTKTDACKAKGNGATKCLNSLRVLYNNYDLDCDLVVVCEYFDGPATTVNTATPGTPPAAITPTAVLPPSPSLLPKAGDLVLSSAYAVGAVQYTCNRASGLFANITVIANLYTNPPQNGTIGTYLSANEIQVYSLTDGGKAQIGASDKGASYAQNSTVLSDGGYGSLNRSYSTATGNLSLANVTYIAITGTVGGVLPNKAVCSKAAGTLALIPSFPWTVPYEANVTFYSKFTPPV